MITKKWPGVSSKELLVEWSLDQRYKHLHLPWRKSDTNNITASACYAYCLTAYLSYIDALTGKDISMCSGDYDSLFKDIFNEVDTEYGHHKKNTQEFFNKRKIPLSVKSKSFRNPNGAVALQTIQQFLYESMIPIIAIVDPVALKHNAASPNSYHSVIVLGITGEGYLLYNPNVDTGDEEVSVEHKVNFNRGWEKKVYEGIFLVKKGMRIQVKKALAGVLTLDYFTGDEENE